MRVLLETFVNVNVLKLLSFTDFNFRVYAPKCHACGKAITPVEVTKCQYFVRFLTLEVFIIKEWQ